MDKFLGKFNAVAEMTEGFDAYFDAMKLPAETREMMRKSMSTLVTCLFQETDDSYKEYNDYGERKEEFVFKLGVPVTADILGMEIKNTYTLSDGGKSLEGVHDWQGQITTTSRYWKGDLVVFETHGNGASMTTYLKKIPE